MNRNRLLDMKPGFQQPANFLNDLGASFLRPNQLMANSSNLRPDGSPKGRGFLGELQRPDGRVSTELTAGVTIDGRAMNIPLLVPTLDKAEMDYLLNSDPNSPEFYQRMPPTLMRKAVDHALQRMRAGKSQYAE